MSLKPKYELMNIEDMKVNEPYAFSLSPKKEFLYVPEHKDTMSYIYAYLFKLKDALKVISSADFEKINFELSKNGRPHVHGYIVVHDIVNFYGRDIRHLQDIGTYAIKEIGNKEDDARGWIENNNKWELYIHKQNHLYTESCKDINIINSKEIRPMALPEKRIDVLRALCNIGVETPKADH